MASASTILKPFRAYLKRRKCRAPFVRCAAQNETLRYGGLKFCVILLLTTFANAQDSQFFFDANGNLFVQTAETAAPPQIIGQPQNRMVAPGDAGSFFVVAADTRALTYR